ncbi:hypothetical protein BDZ94DRAFT_1303651 [Collybia nuda]|uniref:Uncharacterized protein n=1 Tax=Collybia nuda TaxID=64659 RepID=A0A9P5YH24_9AGAR|nr:hypothetical protein BDZ94DRAFT_1303651 [Collybia nuda]
MFNVNNEILEQYTPTYLRPQVFGDMASPEPLTVEELPELELKMASDDQQTKDLDSSDPESDGEHDHLIWPPLVRRLPLQRQNKERRKESRGIR